MIMNIVGRNTTNPTYTTPANELNDLIAYYKTQLKARATRRKAGKDVSKETPIAPATA